MWYWYELAADWTITTKQPNGAEKAINILDKITEKEKALLDIAINGLKGNIAKGVDFVAAK